MQPHSNAFVRQVKLPSQGRPASPSRTMLSPSHVSSIPDASGKLVTWTKKQGFRSHKSQQNHFKITSWVDPRFIFMYRMCMMCTLKRINAWSILPHFKGYLSSVTWEIIGSVQENICIPEHLSVSTAYQKHPTRNISINTNDVHIGIYVYIYAYVCSIHYKSTITPKNNLFHSDSNRICVGQSCQPQVEKNSLRCSLVALPLWPSSRTPCETLATVDRHLVGCHFSAFFV